MGIEYPAKIKVHSRYMYEPPLQIENSMEINMAWFANEQ